MDTDTFTNSKIHLNWSVSFGDGGYFVEERLGASKNYVKWGPLPSKTIAVALVEERMQWAQSMLEEMAQRGSTTTTA